MRKKIYLIILALMLALSSVLFAGCDIDSALPDVSSDTDRMITQQVTVPPTEYNPKKAVYATIGRLSKYSTYKATSSGTSVAAVSGLFDYVQKTDCVTIKHGDEFYSESKSSSKLVSVKHEAFAKGDNIAYRIDGGKISNSSALAYKEVYGVTPDKLLADTFSTTKRLCTPRRPKPRTATTK